MLGVNDECTVDKISLESVYRLGSLTNSYIYTSPLYACVRYGEHAVVGSARSQRKERSTRLSELLS